MTTIFIEWKIKRNPFTAFILKYPIHSEPGRTISLSLCLTPVPIAKQIKVKMNVLPYIFDTFSRSNVKTREVIQQFVIVSYH